MKVSLPLLVSLLVSSSAAYAENAVPPATGASTSEPAPEKSVDHARAPLTLLLEIDPRIAVDGTELRSRLHQELGHKFTSDSQAYDGRLQIQRQGEDEALVRYQLHDDPELVRSVPLPKRTGERADVLFWLVSNLISDQTAGLLAELTPSANPPAASTIPEGGAPSDVKAPPNKGTAEKSTQPTSAGASRELTRKNTAPALPLPALELGNLSFFHPITLVPNTEAKRFRGELGFAYSRVYGISGVGLTAGALRVDGPTEGALFAGLYAQWAGPTHGYVSSGLVSYGSGPIVGVVNSGLFNLQRAEATGALFAGAVNVNQDLTGLEAAGLLNVAKNVKGAQVSLMNIGGDVEGVQIGLVNISDNLTGMPIGLVNVVKNGRHQAQTWATVQDTNSGYRSSLAFGYKNSRGPLYTLVSLGVASPLEANVSDTATKAKPTVATASSGMGVEVGKEPFYVAGDIQYFVEAETEESETPRQGVEYRAMLGLDFGHIGAFAGVGARNTFEGPSVQLAPEGFVGLGLF